MPAGRHDRRRVPAAAVDVADVAVDVSAPTGQISTEVSFYVTTTVSNEGPATAHDVHTVIQLSNRLVFLGIYIDDVSGGSIVVCDAVPPRGSIGGTLTCTVLSLRRKRRSRSAF